MSEKMMPNFEDQPNEKEARLEEIRTKVEKITDALEHPVDEGIKESVVAMLANEFPTTGSCEGHLTDDEEGRQFLYPYIDVHAPAPEGWRESEELKKEWSKANAAEKEKIEKLLEEFYTDREVDEDYKLVPHPKGIFNAFTLASNRRAEDNLRPDDNEEEVLTRARKEMEEFTNFLMEKL